LLSGDAVRVLSAQGTITGTGTITADGHVELAAIVEGAASITGSGLLTGAARMDHNAYALLSGQGDLVGAAVVTFAETYIEIYRSPVVYFTKELTTPAATFTKELTTSKVRML
jgi:hypothetical protein